MDKIDPRESTTVNIGSWTKQADKSWAPTHTPPHPIKGLHAVLEIGLSESAEKLATSARDLLETPGSSVQLVVTMEISRDIPEINIRRWELGDHQCNVCIAKAWQTAQQATCVCVSELRMSRTSNTTDVSGDLTLPFKGFSGRDPNPGNQLERDIVISRPMLEDLAERVWAYQEFTT